MARYWLGPWVWGPLYPGGNSNGWKQPAGAVACLDLRSEAQCAGTVTPSGFGLFVTPNATDLGADYENLGTDPLATWTQQALNRWQSVLSLPATIAANNLREVVWETLTIQSDPTGVDRARPLVPTAGTPDYELWLAGVLVKRKRFDLSDPEATPLIDQLKRIYRKLRQDSLDGISLPDHYRKVLGHWVRKYRINYRNFQPADLPDEPDVEPTTTITDDFNRADGTTIGNQLTWTEYADYKTASNRVKLNADNYNFGARADSDLSSTDHYSQVNGYNFGDIGGGWETQSGCMTRCGSASSNGYIAHMNKYAGYQCQFSKVVSGTYTDITNVSDSPASGDTLKMSANGSLNVVARNGTTKITQTDTSITTGTRCGIWVYSYAAGLAAEVDNFEAADLAAAAKAPPPCRRHYQQLLAH